MQFRTFLFLILVGATAQALCSQAQAGSVVIPLSGIDAPASDLTYQGRPIDRDHVVDLVQKGVDVSQLEPAPSDVWSLQSLPIESAQEMTKIAYPREGETVRFDSYMSNPQYIFRSRVSTGLGPIYQTYQLLMGIDMHASLMRAALLRKLGYKLPTPKWYPKLQIRFDSLKARESFLNAIGSATELSTSRWVIDKPEKEPLLTIQDVVMQPAQIDVPMYQYGILSANAVGGRRAIRGLILPLVWLDIAENINIYSWQMAHIISNDVVMNHPYANAFIETTLEDAKWMARKIGSLTKEDLSEIVKFGKYPEDAAALITEKMVARRDQMLQVLGIAPELKSNDRNYAYDLNVSHGQYLRGGKLSIGTKDNFLPGYAERFSYGDPDSPLSNGEITKYLVIDGGNAGLQSFFAKINKDLVGQSISDLASSHQYQELKDYFTQVLIHPEKVPVVPIKTWGGPIGSAQVSASRSVVSGSYYGDDSKVQLVDNLAVKGSVGFFLGMQGLSVNPNLQGNLSLQRNYIHVRAVPSMKDALQLSKNLKSLYLYGFMNHVGALLETGNKTAHNESPDDHASRIRDNLNKFLAELKPNEIFFITDTLSGGANLGVSVPVLPFLDFKFLGSVPIIGTFLAQAFGNGPSADVGLGAAAVILRRTAIFRTVDGIQIYVQRMNTEAANTSFDVNWWLQIYSSSHTEKVGHARTQAYLLDKLLNLTEASGDPATQEHLAVALSSIFKNNNTEVLHENFSDYLLEHAVTSKVNQAKFLRWKWYSSETSHELRVQPPAEPTRAGFKPKDYERTLFSHGITKIQGTNDFGFLSDVISAFDPNIPPLASSSDINPSNTFLGTARWTAVTSEAELTPGRTTEPVTTVENHWAGWNLPKKNFFKILDGIESKIRPVNLDQPIFNRNDFNTMKAIQLYEINSKLVAYKGVIDRIHKILNPTSDVRDSVASLIQIEGEADLNSFCDQYAPALSDPPTLEEMFSSPYTYRTQQNGEIINFTCVKPWMKEMLQLRAGDRPTTTRQFVSSDTRALQILQNNIDQTRLMNWMGKDNYFFQVRVTGFRTHDENGDQSSYSSDTVGMLSSKQSPSVFDDFAKTYGISSYEIFAHYLTDGY